MKRERSSERKSKNVSKRRRIDTSSNDSRQWYEVMLALAAKSAYELTHAINKSEERRELPTIPQPTHQMEWLARVNFEHRSMRRNIPQQRRHKVSTKKQDLNSSFYVY
ncbi:uncharacterized protein LOC133180088 isoform X2 [Saccostrea echinata]|uniref:uncharacterized protein LOC133180088 isoform X2 n=1 Tax=Saccostrea echinata TaxID=191078 RepID=UPI002A7EC6D8|nr:uncharacterized protein LOC133180088 isoform X2 [Saccostrea echinata]